jgi:hypothetical protein
MKDVGTFTVTDIDGVGRLAYDSASQEWIFSSTFEKPVRLPFPQAAKGTSVVSVQYTLCSGIKRGQLVLRAGLLGVPNAAAPRSVDVLRDAQLRPGKIQIGADLSVSNHWNGCISELTVGPEGLGANQWKAYCELEDGAPNPLNHNLLDRSLIVWDQT